MPSVMQRITLVNFTILVTTIKYDQDLIYSGITAA